MAWTNVITALTKTSQDKAQNPICWRNMLVFSRNPPTANGVMPGITLSPFALVYPWAATVPEQRHGAQLRACRGSWVCKPHKPRKEEVFSQEKLLGGCLKQASKKAKKPKKQKLSPHQKLISRRSTHQLYSKSTYNNMHQVPICSRCWYSNSFYLKY